MSLEQYLAIILGVAVLIGIPVMLLLGLRDLFGKKASERPSHTSTAAAFLGALDRIVRPSAEHQINEENRVVKDEDDVDAGKE